MQFHEYTTFRTLMARHGSADDREYASKVNSRDFRKTVLEWFATEGHAAYSTYFQRGMLAVGESTWMTLERPYYNVWPIATTLAQSVKLDLRFSQVQIPFDAILLRFPRGHEPHQLKTALLLWPKGTKVIRVFGFFADRPDRTMLVDHLIEDDDKVENWLMNLERHSSKVRDCHRGAESLVVRLVVFIGLLARGEDFITPIVLAKDRERYEAALDDEARRWIEDRAARRAGRGFDVGKKLQLTSEASPHWRNPHLCLFWTGEGRTVPIIKRRSGAIIQSVSMADVPTGYFGPENEGEDQLGPNKTPREFITKRRRFSIMQRDNFSCRLCGASRESKTTLHVDHRIPLAKGGSNDDDNLWTLCDRCNLGKSDTILG